MLCRLLHKSVIFSIPIPVVLVASEAYIFPTFFTTAIPSLKMMVAFFRSAVLVTFLLVGNISAAEETVPGHEITKEQARESLLKTDVKSIVLPPICGNFCSDADKGYCLSKDLMDDHCCCDKHRPEPYPFIAHKCISVVASCKPVAANCDQYDRLRDCCCRKLTLLEWKDKEAGGGGGEGEEGDTSSTKRVESKIKMAPLIIFSYLIVVLVASEAYIFPTFFTMATSSLKIMVAFFRSAVLVTFLLVTNISAVEKTGRDHEITEEQARESLLKTDVNSIVVPPGCRNGCNDEDKRYCLSKDLIDDHCCCDKYRPERYPFIAHKCIFVVLCKPVADGCEMYHRLGDCCCRKLALLKLKDKEAGGGAGEG
ncbi:hypothetical protein JTB14_000741 [Gonioctena quinquepunctata]|nr:hypothetical protein JTB14_000741 [Gonioctena quinquepunctata]